MGKFETNDIIARDSSVITGSLIVNGGITASFSGTSSYAITSSYSINSATASYTTITTIPSSSFSSTALTSSLTLTSSIVLGPQYAPTQNVGYYSSNIYFGTPDQIFNVAASQYGGIHFTPILVTKNCLATTLACPIITTAASNTIRYALYSNSTSSYLPEYLLGQVSASVGIIGTTVISGSFTTPVSLSANTVYWIAFAPHNGIRFIGSATTTVFTAYNPLVYQRYTTYPTPAGVTTPYLGNTTIRSGSTYNQTFVPTSSQTLSSYTLLQTADAGLLTYPPPLMPFLRVTY